MARQRKTAAQAGIDIRVVGAIVAILINIGVTTGTVIWGVATTTAQVSGLSEKVGKLELQIESLRNDRDRVSRLEENLKNLASSTQELRAAFASYTTANAAIPSRKVR